MLLLDKFINIFSYKLILLGLIQKIQMVVGVGRKFNTILQGNFQYSNGNATFSPGIKSNKIQEFHFLENQPYPRIFFQSLYQTQECRIPKFTFQALKQTTLRVKIPLLYMMIASLSYCQFFHYHPWSCFRAAISTLSKGSDRSVKKIISKRF